MLGVKIVLQEIRPRPRLHDHPEMCLWMRWRCGAANRIVIIIIIIIIIVIIMLRCLNLCYKQIFISFIPVFSRNCSAKSIYQTISLSLALGWKRGFGGSAELCVLQHPRWSEPEGKFTRSRTREEGRGCHGNGGKGRYRSFGQPEPCVQTQGSDASSFFSRQCFCHWQHNGWRRSGCCQVSYRSVPPIKLFLVFYVGTLWHATR